MKEVHAMVVKQGYRIVTLPCGVVLPGEICSAVHISKFIALPAELPQDVACFCADADYSMHIAGGDNVVPSVNLIDTVDVEEIIGVLFRPSIITSVAGEGIAHADMVCGSPFEDQVARLDVNFLEQIVINPAALS
jgi:hypothetical protein